MELLSVYFLLKVAPLGRKRAYTGCTQTTAIVPTVPEIPRRASHLSIIQAQCCLTSVFKWELGVSNIANLLTASVCYRQNIAVTLHYTELLSSECYQHACF